MVDTNVILRGFVNPSGAAGCVLQACERRRAIIVLSKPLMDEYRAVLTDPSVTSRYPDLDLRKVEIALGGLRYRGDFIRSVTARFVFPRDARDEKLIELAISGHASHIVTTDKDLLALPAGRDDASKRFRQRLPNIGMVIPGQFLNEYEAGQRQ